MTDYDEDLAHELAPPRHELLHQGASRGIVYPAVDGSGSGHTLNITVDAHVRHAFILGEADVRKVWKLLAKFDIAMATAMCADSITHEGLNVEQLLALNNSKKKCILGLQLWATSSDHKKEAEVLFINRRWSGGPIRIRLQGPEPATSKLKEQLADIVDGLKPWYSPLSLINVTLVSLYAASAVGLFAFSVLIDHIRVPITESRPARSIGKAVLIAAVAMVVAGLIAALVWLLNRLRMRYFPIATFAIGQGLARHKVADKVRWTVVIGGVVSLFASIVATLMFGGF